MGGMIGVLVTGTALVCALALAECPFGVIGGCALGMLALGTAWGWLSERRDRRRARAVPKVAARMYPWTEQELAALDNDLMLRELLTSGPEGRREGKFR